MSAVEHVGGCNTGCEGDDHLLLGDAPSIIMINGVYHQPGTVGYELARSITRLEQRVAELEPAVDRVRRLHSQSASALSPGKWCQGCGHEEPCPTIRALNGQQVAR